MIGEFEPRLGRLTYSFGHNFTTGVRRLPCRFPDPPSSTLLSTICLSQAPCAPTKRTALGFWPSTRPKQSFSAPRRQRDKLPSPFDRLFLKSPPFTLPPASTAAFSIDTIVFACVFPTRFVQTFLCCLQPCLSSKSCRLLPWPPCA